MIRYFLLINLNNDASIINKAISITDNIVPASPLDNVFKMKNATNFKVTLYDFLNGQQITTENQTDFYKNITDNVTIEISNDRPRNNTYGY